ncbi:MAG: hypothetical protein ACQEQL_01505 [Pseudomonadota bacterium]
MKNTNGNALFLILIAVALFAALSYAVTQSGRGGGNIDREKDDLIASGVIQQAGLLEHAVRKVKTLGGCTDAQVSFHYDSNGDGTVDGSDHYNNPDAPGTHCYVFHPNGGGITFPTAPEDWLDSAQSANSVYGKWAFRAERLSNIGIYSNADVFAILPFLRKETCLAINRKLGVPEYSGDPPQEHDDVHYQTHHQFIGSASWTGSSMQTMTLGKSFAGEHSACIEGGPNGGDQVGQYFFYHVLMVR